MRAIPLINDPVRVAWVDDADYATLSAYRWSHHVTGYATRNEGRGKSRRCIYMHRQVMNVLDAGRTLVVDHINRDRLDNRRENLRVTTPRYNSYNRGGSAHNPTGYKGVKLDPRRKTKPYRATIHVEDVTIHIGSYACPHCAALAYNRMTLETYGLRSYLNAIPDDHCCVTEAHYA